MKLPPVWRYAFVALRRMDSRRECPYGWRADELEDGAQHAMEHLLDHGVYIPSGSLPSCASAIRSAIWSADRYLRKQRRIATGAAEYGGHDSALAGIDVRDLLAAYATQCPGLAAIARMIVFDGLNCTALARYLAVPIPTAVTMRKRLAADLVELMS